MGGRSFHITSGAFGDTLCVQCVFKAMVGERHVVNFGCCGPQME